MIKKHMIVNTSTTVQPIINSRVVMLSPFGS